MGPIAGVCSKPLGDCPGILIRSSCARLWRLGPYMTSCFRPERWVRRCSKSHGASCISRTMRFPRPRRAGLSPSGFRMRHLPGLSRLLCVRLGVGENRRALRQPDVNLIYPDVVNCNCIGLVRHLEEGRMASYWGTSLISLLCTLTLWHSLSCRWTWLVWLCVCSFCDVFQLWICIDTAVMCSWICHPILVYFPVCLPYIWIFSCRSLSHLTVQFHCNCPVFDSSPLFFKFKKHVVF